MESQKDERLQAQLGDMKVIFDHHHSLHREVIDRVATSQRDVREMLSYR